MRSGRLPFGPAATLAVLSSGAGVFTILQSILSPALPVIQAELGTTQLHVTWVVTAYLLSASICTPVLGRLGDTFGKKRVLVIAMSTLAFGVLVSGLSTSIGMMICGRVIQGVGGAIFPLSFGILRDQLEGRSLHRSVGVLGSVAAGGVAIGSLLSGLIVDTLGFRWLFWFPLIVLLISLLFMRVLSDSPVHPSPVSVAPILSFATWLTGLLLLTTNAQVWGIASPITIGVAVISVLAFIGWILAERYSRGALIDLKLMKSNIMWTTSVLSAVIGIPLFSLQTFVPQYLQAPRATGYGFDMTVLQSVLVMLPLSVALFAMGFVSHHLIAKYGFRKALVGSVAVVLLGCALLVTPVVEIWQVSVASLLAGVGMGAVLTIMPVLVVTGVSADQTGVAGGINANVRAVGGAIGTAVIAAIINAFEGPTPRAQDYQYGFTVFIFALLLALIACLLIRASGESR
ncbi:MFS transporter [Leucobacter denitrificans]|uniref:MFS transporter n=1 Tax=Leucobacter denitrificans TaxID=683042 RepID=A0A7G9S3F0_9MICO|nr:MFS transporter [Leucobacter denitrificans]QNN62375.1 MFS transporter [Leucobacter denitrificans]